MVREEKQERPADPRPRGGSEQEIDMILFGWEITASIEIAEFGTLTQTNSSI